MQRCPNCGSEARNGARFCTSCGHRFPDELSAAPLAEAPATHGDPLGWNLSQHHADQDDLHDGWPGAPPAADTERSNWAAEPSQADSTGSGETASTPAGSAGFWPESSSEPWPAFSADAINNDPEIRGADEPEAAATASSAYSGDAGEHRPRGDALELLEQLRAAILAQNPANPTDLSGVISDLEVAVTPPGALPPDDVADLHDAIFAARENPRDIDTIVDLTRRIDGLASLVIAYERAIAAIERSLDVLKKTQHPTDTESPSPTAVGEGLG